MSGMIVEPHGLEMCVSRRLSIFSRLSFFFAGQSSMCNSFTLISLRHGGTLPRADPSERAGFVDVRSGRCNHNNKTIITTVHHGRAEHMSI